MSENTDDDLLDDAERERGWWRYIFNRWVAAICAFALIAVWLLGWYWSRMPAPVNVPERVAQDQPAGVVTVDTLVKLAQTLLDKPGGYLSNDILPPGVMMDNMPNFEYGALIQIRDFAHVLRNDFSRSQSVSLRDPDLSYAEPRFNIDHTSWIWPASERAYSQGIGYLKDYRDRLEGGKQPPAYFFVRARNLNLWLQVVSRRLGGLTQRLAAAAGTTSETYPLGAGLKAATRGTEAETSWWYADDAFYRARGAAWALLALLQATRADFHQVLVDKKALSSYEDLIRVLQATQRPVTTPVILTGSGFGIFANNDLTMAAYMASANAIIINMEPMLQQD